MSVDAGSCCADDDACWADSLTIEANANVAAPNSISHPNVNVAPLNSNSQPERHPILRRRPKAVSGDAEAIRGRTDARQLRKSSSRHHIRQLAGMTGMIRICRAGMITSGIAGMITSGRAGEIRRGGSTRGIMFQHGMHGRKKNNRASGIIATWPCKRLSETS